MMSRTASLKEKSRRFLRLVPAPLEERECQFRKASLQVVKDALMVVVLWQKEGPEALEDALQELTLSLTQLNRLAWMIVHPREPFPHPETEEG
jgi:hypothetical protein